MGLTTENVLVRLEGSAALEALADAVRRSIGPNFEELQAGAKPDRTVVLWTDPESAWTAVADTEFGAAKKLAAALSRETGATTVAVGVFDSDEAWMRLCRGGKPVDTLKLRGKTPHLRPERWADALQPPATPQDLQDRLAGETVFVEQRVALAAKLLGATAEQCLARADEIDESSGPLLRLGFRSRLLPEKREAEGPPAFEMQDRFAGIEAGAGDELQQLALSVRNLGGASEGVEVRLEGDAIENGLLQAESVTLVRFLDQQQTERVTQAFQRSAARVERMAIPAGTPPLEPALLGKLLAADPALFTKGRLWANFAIRAAKPGEGRLRVLVTPLAHPAGAVVWEAPVRVSDAIRKPLRSADTGSPYARKLATPHTLVGLVALDAEKSAVLDAAANALRGWLEALGPREGRWRIRWEMQSFDGPRDTLIADAKSPTDKPWKKVLGRLADHSSVWAGLYADKDEREPLAGFVFDAAPHAAGLGADQPAPQLAFWADQRTADSAERQRLHDALAALIDEAAEAAPLLQGFVAAWDAPDGLSADHTLYELACGIVGQGVQGRPWCGRWLRGVAETMWLGPSLQQLSPGLEAVATLEPAGSAAKVRLKLDASLDQLEAVLAPVLPSAEDWRLGVQRRYGRG